MIVVMKITSKAPMKAGIENVEQLIFTVGKQHMFHIKMPCID